MISAQSVYIPLAMEEPAMPVPNPNDPNAINLSEYKGSIAPCRYCRPEETLLGRTCQYCLGQGHLAQCLNCHGTGKFTGGSIWDGGRSTHTSTCNICGGKGTFPARESEYRHWLAANPVADAETELGGDDELRSLPVAVKPMPNTRMR